MEEFLQDRCVPEKHLVRRRADVGLKIRTSGDLAHNLYDNAKSSCWSLIERLMEERALIFGESKMSVRRKAGKVERSQQCCNWPQRMLNASMKTENYWRQKNLQLGSIRSCRKARFANCSQEHLDCT